MGKDLTVRENRNYLKVSGKTKYRLKELGKLFGYAGVSVSGLGVSLLLGLPAVGFPMFLAGFVECEQKMLNAITNDSNAFEGNLFKLSRRFKCTVLSQSSIVNPEEVVKMSNFFKQDSDIDQRRGKGSIMLLQTMVLFQREKQILEKKASTKDENGVYDGVYKTNTHKRNVENFKALERMGYIKIDDISESEKKYQIIERIGFGQIKDALKASKAMLIGKQDEKAEYKKQLYAVKFRLTDKNIDFDELYNLFNTQQNEDVINALRGLYSSEYGILVNKNLDIKNDLDGLPIIIYGAKQSLAHRADSAQQEQKKHQDYVEELRVDDEIIQNNKSKYLKNKKANENIEKSEEQQENINHR